MNNETTVEEILNLGHILLLNLINQVDCLVEVIDSTKNNEKYITPSIVILSFVILEGYTDFISELIVAEHENSSPTIVTRLKDMELNTLQEKSPRFIENKCEVEMKDESYLRILMKLEFTTKLLARAYEKTNPFDRGNAGWGYIKKLKEKRNEITHIRFNTNISQPMESYESIERINPASNINPMDIVEGLFGVRWYFRINGSLLVSIFNGKINSLLLNDIDSLLTNVIKKTIDKYDIKECIHNKKEKLKCMIFEESFDDKAVNNLTSFTA